MRLFFLFQRKNAKTSKKKRLSSSYYKWQKGGHLISIHGFAHQNPGARLLTHIRDIMGETILSPDEKLTKITHILASDMDTDVCSLYILKGETHLELMASYGSSSRSFVQIPIPLGVGVIGMIAKAGAPLAVSDLGAYPAFQKNPHLPLDNPSSFLGVPLMRGGKSIGVLALKSKNQRVYSTDDLDLMQTIAILLSEWIVIHDGGYDRHQQNGFDEPRPMVTFHGLSLSPGTALGRAVLHHPQLSIHQLLTDDTGLEKKRFEKALHQTQESIQCMINELPALSSDRRGILETYQMFAEDKGWILKVRRAIESGLTAEAAIQKIGRDLRVQMRQIEDPLIRERLWDLEDLSRRLMRYLLGDGSIADQIHGLAKDRTDIILVAQSMGPAELLDYEKFKIKGLILEEGLQTAHVAIIAKALNIPVVSRIIDGVLKIDQDEEIIVDAARGIVILRPNDRTRLSYEKKRRVLKSNLETDQALLLAPAITRDGTPISLYLNGGLPMDVDRLSLIDTAGIGLYRTEIPFMMQATLPSVSVQTKLYADLIDKAGDKILTFRTLDVGGDKILPYLDVQREENPALGWRAIRLGIDRPMLLRAQLRAMIAASQHKTLRVMFPMIAHTAEFLEVRHMLDLELEKAGPNVPKTLHVGVMLEVPSALWSLESLLPHVDFVSVGTNDLAQFFFAADRSNPRLSARYDVLSPPFLSLLKGVVQTCRRFQKPLSLCGEMAGNPIEAAALLCLGYRHLSLHLGGMIAIKRMIGQIDIPNMMDFLMPRLKGVKATLRQDLSHYARDYGIPI